MSRLNAWRGKKSSTLIKEEVDRYDGDEELLTLMDGIIGEDFIVNATGITNMLQIEHLEIVIDTTVQSIFGLCELLPNLKYLVLDTSVLGSVRDLGIGLRYIVSLSLSSCGLNDLDGIGVLTGLQEICLSDNHISDVAPLAMHENLQTLNVSGNKLTDISIGDALSSCPKLKALFLSRNPITKAPNYRIIMSSMITSLEMLDGSPVDHQTSKNKVTNGMILEAAAAMREVEEDLEDELRLEFDILESEHNSAMASKTGPPLSSRGPPPSSPFKSNGNKAGSSGLFPDTGSELTHGSSVVLAGNMAAAMRKRRGKVGSSTDGVGSQRGSVNVDGEEGTEEKEYESTLDVLDSAASANYHSSAYDSYSPAGKSPRGGAGSLGSAVKSGGYMFTQFLREGDITSSVLGRKSTDTSSNQTNAATKPPSNRQSRDAGEGSFFLDEDEHLFPERPSVSASPRVAKSATRNSRIDFEANSDSSRPGSSRPGSNSSNRPKSAVVSNSRSNSASMGGMRSEKEPRQLNSSRPQSAMSNSSNGSGKSSLLMSAFSVPFKVDHLESADSAPASRPSSGASRLSHGNSFSDFEVDEEAYSSNPYSTYALASGIANNHTARSVRVSSSGYQQPSSIVHYDIVRRHVSSDSSPGVKSDDEDSSSDAEDIAVAHAARHRMMASSGSTSNLSSTRTRNLALSQLSTTSDRPAPAVNALAEGELSAQVRQNNASSHRRPPVRPPSATGSTKAGISLGFNLAGSLAAIDQWAQDLNSEEESDAATDRQSRRTTSGNISGHNRTVPSVRRDESVGDASSALAPNNARGGDFQESGGVGSSERRRQGGGDNRILSRDAIINMCVGKAGGAGRQLSDDDDSGDESEMIGSRRATNSHTPNRNVGTINQRSERMELPTNSSTTTSRQSTRSDGTHSERISAPTRHTVQSRDVVPARDSDEDELAVLSRDRARQRTAVVPDFSNISTTRSAVPAGNANSSATNSNGGEILLNQVSPPRFTAEPVVSELPTTQLFGTGVYLQDAEIVTLLRQPPKTTLVLRTKGNFQDYFRGIKAARIRSLLQQAYSDLDSAADREAKVNKRMDLLKEVVAE